MYHYGVRGLRSKRGVSLSLRASRAQKLFAQVYMYTSCMSCVMHIYIYIYISLSLSLFYIYIILYVLSSTFCIQNLLAEVPPGLQCVLPRLGAFDERALGGRSQREL